MAPCTSPAGSSTAAYSVPQSLQRITKPGGSRRGGPTPARPQQRQTKRTVPGAARGRSRGSGPATVASVPRLRPELVGQLDEARHRRIDACPAAPPPARASPHSSGSVLLFHAVGAACGVAFPEGDEALRGPRSPLSRRRRHGASGAVRYDSPRPAHARRARPRPAGGRARGPADADRALATGDAITTGGAGLLALPRLNARRPSPGAVAAGARSRYSPADSRIRPTRGGANS